MTAPAQLRPYTPERRMLLDGKLVESVGGGEFDNINPATAGTRRCLQFLAARRDDVAEFLQDAVGEAVACRW